MANSLVDLGHTLVEHAVAELVIAIRDFSKMTKRYSDKKYILFQIEQYVRKASFIDGLYQSEPDEIWGFDIDNESEIYTPLGYHPCLQFTTFLPKDVDVGFMGWQHGRRNTWRAVVRNKWTVLNTFDDAIREENITRARINLNIHFREGSMFTEWGRIAYFLANTQFFISETFHCSIAVPQFDSPAMYDGMVDHYLTYPEEREQRAREMTQSYKLDFDMRDILKSRL